MRQGFGRFTKSLGILAVGCALFFTACAETMMSGDKKGMMEGEKAMMKEGKGMMEGEKEKMMKEKKEMMQ